MNLFDAPQRMLEVLSAVSGAQLAELGEQEMTTRKRHDETASLHMYTIYIHIILI